MKKIQVVAIVAFVASPVMAADLLVPGTYPTIQNAIDAAGPGDVIVVNPGSYPGGLYIAGKSLSIRSASASQAVVISGQGGRGLEVVNVPSPGLVLRGLEFTGCAGGPLGGAILATSSWLDVESCAFRSNRIDGGGGTFGGAAIYASDSVVRLAETSFISNRVELASGGFPYAFGGAVFFDRCELTIASCIFNMNAVSAVVPSASWAEAHADGGALAARWSRGVVRDSVFSMNRADSSVQGFGPIASSRGSAASLASVQGARFLVENCDFIDNTASAQSSNSYYNGTGSAIGALAFGVDGEQSSIHEVRSCRFKRNRGEKSPSTNGVAVADIGTIFGENFVASACRLEASFASDLQLTNPLFGAYVGSVRSINGSTSVSSSVAASVFCGLQCPAMGPEIVSTGNVISGNCCIGDLYPNGFVNGADLGILLSEWGPATSTTTADLNMDGAIDGADLGILLGAWGPCPG
jgi:hypothetical protein